MTGKSSPSPDQGFLFDMSSSDIEPSVGFGPEVLGHGLQEGDSTDITKYLGLYVDAVRQLGRGRSNDIGFGALYVNSEPVREVARQHDDDPDKAAVQRRVVDSRATHFDKANQYLLRRSRFRENVARKAVESGLMSEEDLTRLPLLEDASMLEAQWYGNFGESSDDERTKARAKLYRIHKKYQNQQNDKAT